MIWVFWALLGLVIGGILIMAVLARRRRPRHKSVPTLPRLLLKASGMSLGSLLWHLSYPLGYRKNDPCPDSARDYVRDFEAELEEKRRSRSQKPAIAPILD